MGKCVLYFVGLLFVLAACGPEPAASTAVAPHGLPVAPEFQTFYQAYGAEAVLGEPLTELFTPAPGERPLQYFRNVRLEYEPTTGRVIVSPLGAWEFGGLNEQPPAPIPAEGAVRTFPGSEYGLRDAFLQFYETYAGEILLGLPISPQLNVDGKRVQYFENGRLDWLPGAQPGQRVQLGDLGQTHFDNEMVFTYQEMRLARPVSSAGSNSVELAAYVKAPVLYAGEEQVLYVTVLTPGGEPVPDVVVAVTATSAGQTEAVRSIPTDNLGQVALPLNFDIPPGQEVVLTLTALDGNGRSLGETSLTYKTWW